MGLKHILIKYGFGRGPLSCRSWQIRKWLDELHDAFKPFGGCHSDLEMNLRQGLAHDRGW